MTPQEIWFHSGELLVLILGVAGPVTWAAVHLVSTLKNFPPHRHVRNTIVYPSGYAPGRLEREG